jgi:ADP-heptose:LPS heptosyltransferase
MGSKDFLARRYYSVVQIPEIVYDRVVVNPIHKVGVKIHSSTYLDEFGHEVPATNIAVIRMGGLGDLVMLSSALKALKLSRPKLEIVLVTDSLGFTVFDGFPYVDKMISINEMFARTFDRIVDLRMMVEPPEIGGGMPRNLYDTVNRTEWFHTLLFVEDLEVESFIVPSEAAVEKWRGLLGDKDRPLVGIHVNTARDTRSFPVDYVVEMVRLFSKRWNVVVLGVSGRSALRNIGGDHVYNLIGKTGVKDLVAICSLMDFIVAPDSSVMHIAGAFRKKGVAVLGGMAPVTRCKHYPRIKVLHPKGAMKCIPCNDLGNCDLRGNVGAPCMRLITPKTIYEEAERWFAYEDMGCAIDVQSRAVPGIYA